MKSLYIFLFLLLPCFAHAEVRDDLTLDQSKIQVRQETYKVEGTMEHGQFRQVQFVIPEGNVLLALDVKVLSRYPDEGTTFSALSTTGWRLTHVDKLSEYNSGHQPETSFTVEMWAHKYGQWFAPKNSEIQIRVSYIFYSLIGVEEMEFNLAVDETLKNIHPLPTHITVQDAFEKIDLTEGPVKGIEEVTLRSDDRCYWSSRPNCTDCMLTRYNSTTGKRTYRYFYNARSVDGYCD